MLIAAPAVSKEAMYSRMFLFHFFCSYLLRWPMLLSAEAQCKGSGCGFRSLGLLLHRTKNTQSRSTPRGES